MEWDDLCGERKLRAIRTDVRHPFDADASGVAMDLGDLVVFAFEDPSDGYRSCAAPLMVARGPLYSFGGSSPEYINVPVTVCRWTKDGSDSADGVQFVDRRNGRVILTLGTRRDDDYYPSFACEWTPANIADNANK